MLKQYTVYYLEFQNIRLENCFNVFEDNEARTLEMELNKFINEHPSGIDPVQCGK